MTIQLNQQAPDFQLKDQDGQPRRLSDHRGSRNVLLVFYPLAFSGICTGELCQLRDDLPSFESDRVTTLAVSVDSPYVLRAFANQEGYTFRLLSDFWPHGEVARSYGVFDAERGFAVRGTFLIDTQGVVRYQVVNPPSQARDVDGYRRALASLP